VAEGETYALSAVGRDRPGIVAAIAEVLLRFGVNIEDSQMAILRGRFCMVLILRAPAGLERAALEAALEEVGRQLGLDSLALSPLREAAQPSQAEPSCLITVYGADHPGIVHAVAALLADRQVNITDLQTKVAGEREQPLYVMFIEAALPPGLTAGELGELLAEVGRREGVEVTVRELESDVI